MGWTLDAVEEKAAAAGDHAVLVAGITKVQQLEMPVTKRKKVLWPDFLAE